MYYSAGRLFAVTTKPLLLFVATAMLLPRTAQGLAIAFLSSSLTLIAISAGPERAFYARHFSAAGPRTGLPLFTYLTSTLFLAALGMLISALIAMVSFRSPALSLAVSIFLVSEKLADERLRYHLFEKDFTAWGRASILRGAVQVATLALVVGVTGVAVHPAVLVVGLAACNFVVFGRRLDFLWKLLRGNSRSWRWLSRRSARSLHRNRLIWLIALATASVGYVDRLIALVIDSESLPTFMLVVMCFSMTQMAVDFFYLSRHRRDFLQRRISILGALGSTELRVNFVLALLASLCACAVVLHSSTAAGTFPLEYVLAIGLFQSCMALCMVPREIVYWSEVPAAVLRTEMIFWGLIAVSCLGIVAAGVRSQAMLAAAVGCAFVRLVLYGFAAAQSSNAVARSVP